MDLASWVKVSKGSTLSEVNVAPSLTKDQQSQVKVVLTRFIPSDAKPNVLQTSRVTGPK